MSEFLTTHTGSLARPKPLQDGLSRVGRGELPMSAIADQVRQATDDIVARQIELGIDIVNDGEMGKTSFSGYVIQRLGGFDAAIPSGDARHPFPEAEDFPEWGAQIAGRLGAAGGTPGGERAPACVGEITYADRGPLEADIANLTAARGRHSPNGVFMTAASPGTITMTTPNEYYPDHESYLGALAAAMKTEYDAIHQAGFILQLDCPDLASFGRTYYPRHLATLEESRRVIAQNVEALNEATRDIPPETMRIHVCWGNYPGPHHRDVGLRDVIDVVLRARPSGLSIEASNPRHAHEWGVFEDVKLPEGKVLIPGVIDSTSTFVEHPELVAQRILNFARVVGPSAVMAGTDCGFATTASWITVDPRVAMAKLRSMVEGAQLASKLR